MPRYLDIALLSWATTLVIPGCRQLTSGRETDWGKVYRVRQKFLDTEQMKLILDQITDSNQIFNVNRLSFC